MAKKVWVIMESFNEDFHGTISMGYVNTVYMDYNEAVKGAEELVKYNKKCFPKNFYTNWILERVYHE